MITAKMAYTTSRRHGDTTYLARVRLYNVIAGKRGPFFTSIGMGDTREEAEGDALRYTREWLQRDNGPAMPGVENLGKVTKFAFDQPDFV